MRIARFEPIVNAVLYEGYILYPYRASSVKNQRRFTFGGLSPKSWSVARDGTDAWAMQTECLLRGGDDATIEVAIRFLHLVERVDELVTWQEATECHVAMPARRLRELADRAEEVSFDFPEATEIAGPIVRRREGISGSLEVRATMVERGLFKVTVLVANLTEFQGGSDRDGCSDREGCEGALKRTLASTHTLLETIGGAFVSSFDPPEALRDVAAACANIGTWPVLVGRPGETELMLSSPIILYDHPAIAAESPGDLFDGTEIDEILTLRILTLTDDEKRAMRAVDARARALLERTEALGAKDLLSLHGVLRARSAAGLAAGDHVRLRPRAGGDIFDLALVGKDATIAAVEQDFEGRLFYAVTIDEDPGRDLGLEGKPGHRFFFTPEEVERLP